MGAATKDILQDSGLGAAPNMMREAPSVHSYTHATLRAMKYYTIAGPLSKSVPQTPRLGLVTLRPGQADFTLPSTSICEIFGYTDLPTVRGEKSEMIASDDLQQTQSLEASKFDEEKPPGTIADAVLADQDGPRHEPDERLTPDDDQQTLQAKFQAVVAKLNAEREQNVATTRRVGVLEAETIVLLRENIALASLLNTHRDEAHNATTALKQDQETLASVRETNAKLVARMKRVEEAKWTTDALSMDRQIRIANLKNRNQQLADLLAKEERQKIKAHQYMVRQYVRVRMLSKERAVLAERLKHEIELREAAEEAARKTQDSLIPLQEKNLVLAYRLHNRNHDLDHAMADIKSKDLELQELHAKNAVLRKDNASNKAARLQAQDEAGYVEVRLHDLGERASDLMVRLAEELQQRAALEKYTEGVEAELQSTREMKERLEALLAERNKYAAELEMLLDRRDDDIRQLLLYVDDLTNLLNLAEHSQELLGGQRDQLEDQLGLLKERIIKVYTKINRCSICASDGHSHAARLLEDLYYSGTLDGDGTGLLASLASIAAAAKHPHHHHHPSPPHAAGTAQKQPSTTTPTNRKAPHEMSARLSTNSLLSKPHPDDHYAVGKAYAKYDSDIPMTATTFWSSSATRDDPRPPCTGKSLLCTSTTASSSRTEVLAESTEAAADGTDLVPIDRPAGQGRSRSRSPSDGPGRLPVEAPADPQQAPPPQTPRRPSLSQSQPQGPSHSQPLSYQSSPSKPPRRRASASSSTGAAARTTGALAVLRNSFAGVGAGASRTAARSSTETLTAEIGVRVGAGAGAQVGVELRAPVRPKTPQRYSPTAGQLLRRRRTSPQAASSLSPSTSTSASPHQHPGEHQHPHDARAGFTGTVVGAHAGRDRPPPRTAPTGPSPPPNLPPSSQHPHNPPSPSPRTTTTTTTTTTRSWSTWGPLHSLLEQPTTNSVTCTSCAPQFGNGLNNQLLSSNMDAHATDLRAEILAIRADTEAALLASDQARERHWQLAASIPHPPPKPVIEPIPTPKPKTSTSLLPMAQRTL